MPTPSEIIRERRNQLNLTLEEVAKRVGVTRATVSKWEHGDIANMRRDKIQALADVLGIEPTDLIGATDEVSVIEEKKRLLMDAVRTLDENDIEIALALINRLKGNK